MLPRERIVRRAAALSIATTLAIAGPALAQDADAKAPGRNATLRSAFKDVAKKAAAAALKVASRDGTARGYGTVLEDGIVLTTASVVRRDREVLVGGKPARVLGVDRAANLAVLEVDASVAKASVAIGTSATLEVGQFVVAIGGGEEPLAAGVLSAKDRKVEPRDTGGGGNVLFGFLSEGMEGPKRAYEKVLQHDAPVEPGSFGAPLVDTEGRVIAVSLDRGYRGSSYALGIDDAKVAAEKLRKNAGPAPEKPAAKRARLGVAGRALTEEEKKLLKVKGGVLVDEVPAESPGAKAGLEKGDVVQEIDGARVADDDELAEKLSQKSPGDEVVLKVRRGKKRVEVKVVLGAAE